MHFSTSSPCEKQAQPKHSRRSGQHVGSATDTSTYLRLAPRSALLKSSSSPSFTLLWSICAIRRTTNSAFALLVKTPNDTAGGHQGGGTPLLKWSFSSCFATQVGASTSTASLRGVFRKQVISSCGVCLLVLTRQWAGGRCWA
jgi:hypothetical protein